MGAGRGTLHLSLPERAVPVLDARPGNPVFFAVPVVIFFLWQVERVWGTLGVSGRPVCGRLKGGEVLPWERKKRFVRA
ncbi:hypothetical protein GCM10010844_26770 [Deinococcus radiotolerans]|uniref:Transposase n=1 Tax=Deinococcus radiotolerans TaxID=1309407 RepID=A0ABQ2FMU2_9DEIO|nr:hypothetical protein GCM10010844_26770 [Deinococcus radiotolerans]